MVIPNLSDDLLQYISDMGGWFYIVIADVIWIIYATIATITGTEIPLFTWPVAAIAAVVAPFFAYREVAQERDKFKKKADSEKREEYRKLRDEFNAYRSAVDRMLEEFERRYTAYAVRKDEFDKEWKNELPDDPRHTNDDLQEYCDSLVESLHDWRENDGEDLTFKEDFRAVREFFDYCHFIRDEFPELEEEYLNTKVKRQHLPVLHLVTYLARAQESATFRDNYNPRGDLPGWYKLWRDWREALIEDSKGSRRD